MKTETKRWTRLGLSAAFAGTALLTACGQNTNDETPAPETTSNAPEVTSLGSGGDSQLSAPSATNEGGEGEGGVAIDRAGTDPVVFRSALAITEAHIIAARDAHAIGETEAAAEMFAHPVSEVLFDVKPYFDQQGVTSFDDMLIEASQAVFEGETQEQIADRTDAIIKKLRAAAKKAPDDRSTEAEIQAGVIADQIDRAAVMYGIAGNSSEYEPYLDGYGFYHAAKAAYELRKAAINRDMPATAAEIEQALALLEIAYPSVERPDELPGNAGQLTAAASDIILALGN